jgi:hypothetical protein
MTEPVTKETKVALQMSAKFREHWQSQVNKGLQSNLNGPERYVLNVAFEWVCKNFEVTEK